MITRLPNVIQVSSSPLLLSPSLSLPLLALLLPALSRKSRRKIHEPRHAVSAATFIRIAFCIRPHCGRNNGASRDDYAPPPIHARYAFAYFMPDPRCSSRSSPLKLSTVSSFPMFVDLSFPFPFSSSSSSRLCFPYVRRFFSSFARCASLHANLTEQRCSVRIRDYVVEF